MHEALVNRLGGLSLPRKSVVRLTDRPDMTLGVYFGRKTTISFLFRMAEFLDSFHGTSDEMVDPYCDPCNDKGLNVRVCGFCKDCVQFLCIDCQGVHGNLQACRHHDVVQGEDMPKSQVDKPPRFDYCDVHPRLLKNQFCVKHKILLCSLCSSSDHKGCSTKTVEDACKTVDKSETDALYKNTKCLQDKLKSALPPVEKKRKNIIDQEKTMLNDAQKIYDQMIAKAKNMFGSIKNEIQTSCQSQISDLSRHEKKMKDTITKLDSPLSELRELKDKTVDAKLFLRIQEIVSYITKFTTEARESSKTLNFGSLSFIPSQPLQEFLSSSFTIGAIRRSDLKYGTEIMLPKIMFPVSPLKQATPHPQARQASGNQNLGGALPKAVQTPGTHNLGVSAVKPVLTRSIQPLSQIIAAKQGSYNIKLRNDTDDCHITGMAICTDRRILMTDNSNNKVKMFSHDMKSLSSVSVPDEPWDIAVISDREAVATTENKSLVRLDISGSQLSIKETTQLSYDVRGISRYNDKLVVTSLDSKPPSVKLIDQTGRVYWSVSSDQQGQPLFEPCYVSSPCDGRSSTVIVTDWSNSTLTLLNGDTGEVITRHQLKVGKNPDSITTDSDGNVYVCYYWTSEVAVLSGDLSEEKILLSRQDGLSGRPQAIVYDDEAHQLIISYLGINSCNNVDRFQLS